MVPNSGYSGYIGGRSRFRFRGSGLGFRVQGKPLSWFRFRVNEEFRAYGPEGPCTKIVYTLGPMYLKGSTFRPKYIQYGYMDPQDRLRV